MIRVMVVDDSAYSRVAISRMLEQHPEIEVMATASTGEEAIRKIMRERPDVVTLDLEMSGMDGFSVLRWLEANLPTPIVVVSSQNTEKNVFKALEMGAVEFVAKPTGRASPLLGQMEQDLIVKVLSASKARVPAPVPPEIIPELPQTQARFSPGGPALVLIGASTGGPPTIQKILSALPALPVPIVVAQHMPPVFTSLFAERLNKVTLFPVIEARDGECLEPGKAYIAPGGQHTVIQMQNTVALLRLVPKIESDLHCPSVNHLFNSAARHFRERLVAVLLTGMGDDGAEGMLDIHRAGGHCIAESMESAVIFGMPGEAVRLGAADQIIPSWQISAALMHLLQKKA